MITNLKELREKKGLTREDLASMIGVSLVSIYNWESGKRRMHKVFQKKIEKILEVKK